MPEWTEVPAGIIDGATKRFWPAIGDQADVVAKRINSDPTYLARVVQFAIDGSVHVMPVSNDLARLVPTPVHMIADLRGQLAGEHGFKAEHFDTLVVSCLPAGNFPLVVPVAYLETLEVTVRFYWQICQRRYRVSRLWSDLKLGKKGLRVWSPDDKEPDWPAGTVRMVGLDLLAYHDPKDGTSVGGNRAKEAAAMPGVEILALMALAPALGQALDGGVANGGVMPWLDLPGLKADVSGYVAWSVAPFVGFDRDDRGLRLDGRPVGYRYRFFASPAFRECQG